MINSRIISTGSYLPRKIITNEDLASSVNTSDEWIYSRVGIKSRHIAEDFEYSSDLGVAAALDALQKCSMNKNEIDLILVATTTPDKTFPSTAAIIHKKLAISKPIPCFDIQAVCSGFVYGVSIADAMIKSGQYQNILLVGADKLSSITDWQDRSTCVLFSDGAGAVLLSGTQHGDGCVLASYLNCDGQYADIIQTTGGVSSNKESGVMIMDGKAVYKKAVEVMTSAVLEVLRIGKVDVADIDYIIPHQANIRIMHKVAEHLGVAHDKMISTIESYANNSAATIPLALDYGFKHKILKQGQLIVTVAAGGGFTWGANLIKI
jgi:3-oxoacyl-[acyl-carrier-protein] synthase-3